MSDLIELVWAALDKELASTKSALQRVTVSYERAEYSENVPASTLAAAPLAAAGGLADGVNFATLRWISNGRKSGEGAGAGTGVLAVYDAAGNQWLNVDGYAAVTT